MLVIAVNMFVNILVISIFEELEMKYKPLSFNEMKEFEPRRKISLEQSHQLLGCLGNVKSTLNYLLGHEVLIQRLPLTPNNQDPTFGLEMVCSSCKLGQVGGDGGVSGFLEFNSIFYF